MAACSDLANYLSATNNTFRFFIQRRNYDKFTSKRLLMYLEALKKYIESIVATNKPESYEDLFRLSKGAFPDVVYDLVLSSDLGKNLKRKYLGFKVVNNVIPESNPTNYDWRFDHSTNKKLVSLIKKRRHKRIALFGTPSLFIALSKITNDVTLYDINEPLKSHFNHDERIVLVDINTFDFRDILPFDCIIIDPPWYLNYYKIWLKKANSILKMKGEIIVTLFQEMLRPKAKNELKAIKAFARKIGSIELEQNYVSYITPLFETELFNFKNIPCYGNWRVADLLVIRKERNSLLPAIRKFKKDNWTRLEIGTQTIAIDGNKSQGGKIKVRFPYKKNDSLIKSVSERDFVRREVNFMTSRNRGLIIAGCRKVISVLRLISDGVPTQNALKTARLSKAESDEFQKILDVIYI